MKGVIKFIREKISKETKVKILQKVADNLNLTKEKEMQHAEYLFHKKMPKDINELDKIVDWLTKNFEKYPMKDHYFVQENKAKQLLKLIGR